MKKEVNEKKKGGKLKWIIIVIVVVFILSAALGSEGDDRTASTENIDSMTSSDNISTEENTVPEEEIGNMFYPGDVLETNDLKLAYISCGEYSDSNMFIEPSKGNKFVSFEFEFENISNSDVSVGSFDFSCYADGYEVSQALVTSDDSLVSITSLSPDRKVAGIVVFEVPEDAEIIEVEYETSFWTQDKAIFVYQ